MTVLIPEMCDSNFYSYAAERSGHEYFRICDIARISTVYAHLQADNLRDDDQNFVFLRSNESDQNFFPDVRYGSFLIA